jgi:sialidase-1
MQQAATQSGFYFVLTVCALCLNQIPLIAAPKEKTAMVTSPIHIIRHGVVCSLPQEKFGYFGWPSVTRQADGTLCAVASGLRFAHICPWGRSVICKSRDDGQSWSAPQVINNTPLDDRDAGIVSLGGQRLLITWFTSNTAHYFSRAPNHWLRKSFPPEVYEEMGGIVESWSQEMCRQWIGSWLRISEDGEYWGEYRRAPVNTPHGPIVMPDQSWFYLGKRWDLNEQKTMTSGGGPIQAASSDDEGKSWRMLGEIPLPEGMSNQNAHEPHVAALPDGRLFAAIRYEKPFQVLFSESEDGGLSWSRARPSGAMGSPPQLLLHSSGTLVCVYGYRQQPYGQRALISRDLGKSWSDEIALRDDGPDGDLGYPCSVELADKSILSVYYQKCRSGEKCSILYTLWELQ